MSPSAQNKFQRIQALRRKRDRAQDMLSKASKKAIWNEPNEIIAAVKYIMFNDMLKIAIMFAVSAMALGGIAGGFFTDSFADVAPVIGAIIGAILGAIIGFCLGTVGRVLLIVGVIAGSALFFLFFGAFIARIVVSFVAKKQRKRIRSLEDTIDKIDRQINKLNNAI